MFYFSFSLFKKNQLPWIAMNFTEVLTSHFALAKCCDCNYSHFIISSQKSFYNFSMEPLLTEYFNLFRLDASFSKMSWIPQQNFKGNKYLYLSTARTRQREIFSLQEKNQMTFHNLKCASVLRSLHLYDFVEI